MSVCQILVVQFRQQDERDDRTDQAQEHVALCIPDIALCSEEGLRVGRIGKGSQPFDDFVQRRKSERHGDGNEAKPLARLQR